MENAFTRRLFVKAAAAGTASLAVGGGALAGASSRATSIDIPTDGVGANGLDLTEAQSASVPLDIGSLDWLSPSVRDEVSARLTAETLQQASSAATTDQINVSVRRLMDGYTDSTSVNTGEPVRLRINAFLGPYVVSIVRLGWYGGAGASEVYRSAVLPGNSYPGSKYAGPGWDANGMVSCSWPVALTVSTQGWRSGYYLASLNPVSTGSPEAYVPFVVRDDSSTAPIVMQIPFTTYQAYNYWGGKHLYTGDDGIAARVVSFDRPYYDLGGTGHLFNGDFQVLSWLEKNNYPVTYASSIDTHRRPTLMNGRTLFLSVHHDEYWSQSMRNNVVSWIGAGKSLAMLSANNFYWRVRFSNNAAGIADRVMECYKGYPEASSEKTVLFSSLGQSEVQIQGTAYAGTSYSDHDWVVANENHWIYAGTGLRNGSAIRGVIGGEWDTTTTQTPPDTTVIASIPIPSIDHGPTIQSSVVRDLAAGGKVFVASTLKYGLFFGGQLSIREDANIIKITTNLLSRVGIRPTGSPPTTPTTSTTIAATATTSSSTTSPQQPSPTTVPTNSSSDHWLYNESVVPPNSISLGAGYPVQTGQRTQFSRDGSVTGVAWYRTVNDIGTISVSAWKGGVRLAQGVGTPSGFGWVTLPFSAAIDVVAGDDVVFCVHHPNGAYGYRLNGFRTRSVSSPSTFLTTPASTSLRPNGLYAYSATDVLPNLSYEESEYFIMPVFRTTAVGPVPSTSIPTTTGTTPPTTTSPTTPSSSERLYDAGVTPPSSVAIGSTYAVQTAQRVNFSANGLVRGVWWYRTPPDTGTITVSAWRNGVLVGQGTGVRTETGWVFMPFAAPVTVTAGDQLLLGVHHPNGAYAYQLNGHLNRSVTSAKGSMSTPASSASAPNGYYDYTPTPRLPTLSYAASEYFISPDFVRVGP